MGDRGNVGIKAAVAPEGLALDDGSTSAVNMGCGIVVIDQVDTDTQVLQRVVLTKEDLEALLTWID